MPIVSPKIKQYSRSFFPKLLAFIRNFRAQHPVSYALIVAVLAVVLSFIAEKCLRVYYNRLLHAGLSFSLTRLVLVGAVTESLCLVLAFGKRGLEFLYRYRYFFGVGLFALCVFLRINYSSAGMLDGVIQPNHATQAGDIVTGVSRAIRTDEYVVATPMVMSQYRNDFSLTNPDIMADNVLTSVYPKLPNNSLLSILTSPQYLGFTFLPFDNAFSFYQLLPWFIAFFAVFEMLMIITKKRKLMSCIGAFFIVCSPVLLWFDSIQYVMYVALLFDIAYLFIRYGKNWKMKLGISILFGWIAACFAMIVYPAWQVPYGYVLLALLIGLVIEHRKSLKLRDLWYILPILATVIILVLPNILISLDQYRITQQTVYPGQRFEHGGGGLVWMAYSLPSIFFPLIGVPNPCEISGFVSLFPIPIFLGLYIIIRSCCKKQYDPILISLIALCLFLAFMCFIGNGIIAKITLLFLSPTGRICPVLEFACLLALIRILATRQSTKSPKYPAFLAVTVAMFTAALTYFGACKINQLTGSAYMRPIMFCAAFIVYYIAIYCLFDNRKKTIWMLGAIATLFASYQLLTIHPLRSGLDVYTDKPVAEKIRELSSENQDALWLASGSTLADYAATNDARVMNTINYYPVIDRWRSLDRDDANKNIYNRYAHIGVTVSDKTKTNFQLIAADAFAVNINYKDICLLRPTYFLSDKDYNSIPGWSQKLIYAEDGIYIYRLDCESSNLKEST